MRPHTRCCPPPFKGDSYAALYPRCCPLALDHLPLHPPQDEFGLVEREIISYSGAVQLRWGVRAACDAWEKLNAEEDGASTSLSGEAKLMISQATEFG